MWQIGVGTFVITPKIREYINAVLDSGRISYGEYSRALEARFAAMHTSQFGVLSNSGTSSLQVALQALKEIHGWHDDDEVIIPAVTFVATANIVLHNRMTPVLVDIDHSYYELDPLKIEYAITPRTRAIIPVHLFGQPCDMVAIMAIADKHNLAIIEDSCECMGVNYRGVSVGAWGDVGCFSTYVAHLLTTGVGGIAITQDPQIAAKMRSLVNHGRDGIYISADDDKGLDAAQLREIMTRRFSFESIGHSFRITELEAALGLAQLDDLVEIIRQRQDNAVYLTERLEPYQEFIQLPRVRKDAEHAWMMYPLVLRHEQKNDLTAHLETHGIETREMLPLTNQSCYRDYFNEDQYPVARWVNRGGFYVGIHQNLTRDDMDYITATIGEYFAK